jgi:flagellar motility protein MotE (MotC chaperone)
MKKAIYVFQAFILIVFLVKIATVCGLLKFLELPQRSLFSESRALAESSHQGPPGAAVKDSVEDELTQSRNLFTALQDRQKDLENRESALKTEETKLLTLKKEISEKIDVLLTLEQRLNSALTANKEAEAKRFKDLAKVYEAAPPAKAGAMLEKLDVKTAAGITMHMKRDKAGAIWGFLNPQKGVEITREITMAAQKAPE